MKIAASCKCKAAIFYISRKFMQILLQCARLYAIIKSNFYFTPAYAVAELEILCTK